MKPNAILLVAVISSFELYIFTFAKSLSPEFNEVYSDELTEVQVRKRSTRSRGADFDDEDFGIPEYEVNLKVLNDFKKLRLTLPDEPLFSPNFKVHHVTADTNGNPVFKDMTPMREELEYIEENTFVDAEADAALRVHQADDDGFMLDGYVQGARIKRQGKDHVISSRSPEPMMSRSEAEAEYDVVDLHRPLVQGRTLSSDKVSEGTVEMAFVVGYEYSVKFNFSNSAIIGYLTVLVNSVNTRFSLVKDPKVNFKLTGIYFIANRAAQPFVEKSKNGTYGYTFDTVLTLFGEWVGQNVKLLPPHDVITLLTKIKADSPTSGIAYISGACWHADASKARNSSHAVNVVTDDGETYSGSYTLAHELAHSLGAPHDGKSASKDCSWSLGHLMSYEGWGTPQKFHFSNCSKRQMKIFLESSGATCLRADATKNYVKNEYSDKEVGDVLHPSKQCKFETLNHLSYAADDETADEFCRRVICRVPIPGSVHNRVMSRNRPPGYRTPCGRGGTCAHGHCINNEEDPKERLDMHIVCDRRSGDNAAELKIADTPDNQCLILKCSIDKNGKTMELTYGTPMNGSYPCGDNGVCINKRCVGGGNAVNQGQSQGHKPGDSNLDLNRVCQEKLSNPQAKIYEGTKHSEYCKVLHCEWHKDGGVSHNIIPDFVFQDNSYPCGHSGKCVKKECVGESPDRFDMNKECRRKIMNPKAAINHQMSSDEQCKQLHCVFPNDAKPNAFKTRTYKIIPEEGSFPCGKNNGTCRSQVCVG